MTHATLAEWMETRTPPAPRELTAHMRDDVTRSFDTTRVTTTPGERADALIDACDAAFARVLDSGAASRDSALDLLSADAFVTYAFEAAADDPTTISARAEAAMRRVSARAMPHFTTHPQPERA